MVSWTILALAGSGFIKMTSHAVWLISHDYICKPDVAVPSELAMRVEKRTAKKGNTFLRYVFSKVKCRKCPLRESCRIGKGK